MVDIYKVFNVKDNKMASVLAVDDSKVMRDMMKVVLEKNGHTVQTAEDGFVALDIAKSNSFDIVFTDINMPKMSGIALVPKLRELPGFEHIPILMVTTENAEYRKNKAKINGATGWLEKPISEARILKAMAKVLD